MRKLIVVALMLVSTLTYANDSSEKERKIIYDFIHLQLQQGEITLIEAQHLWRKHVITK